MHGADPGGTPWYRSGYLPAGSNSLNLGNGDGSEVTVVVTVSPVVVTVVVTVSPVADQF